MLLRHGRTQIACLLRSTSGCPPTLLVCTRIPLHLPLPTIWGEHSRIFPYGLGGWVPWDACRSGTTETWDMNTLHGISVAGCFPAWYTYPHFHQESTNFLFPRSIQLGHQLALQFWHPRVYKVIHYYWFSCRFLSFLMFEYSYHHVSSVIWVSFSVIAHSRLLSIFFLFGFLCNTYWCWVRQVSLFCSYFCWHNCLWMSLSPENFGICILSF